MRTRPPTTTRRSRGSTCAGAPRPNASIDEFELRRGRRRVRLTRLSRVYWSEAGLTKGDLVDYYAPSVYSVRPLAQAPVSTPLRWDELDAELDPQAFTVDVVLDRVERLGDVAEPLLRGGQRLRKGAKTS